MKTKPPKRPLSESGEQTLLRDLRSLWLVPSLLLVVVAALLFFVDKYPHPILGWPFWVWCVLAVLATLSIYWMVHRRTEALAAALRSRSAEVAASRDQMAALNAVGRAVAAELDLERTLGAICGETAAALGARRAAVALRGGRKDDEQVRAAFGFSPDNLPPRAHLGEAESALTAPIVGRDGLPLGTLFAFEKSQGGFDAADETMLGAIATQAAVAIVNARLYEESRQRSDELRSLAQQVADAVASSNDIARIAGLVSEQALKLIPCQGAGVFLLTDDCQELLPMGYRLVPGEEGGVSAFYKRPLPLETIPALQKILGDSAPASFEDVRALGETSAWAQAGMRSVIAAPLRGHGQGTVGLLLLHWEDRPHRAGEDDLALVAALAGFAAVAVENARLVAVSQQTQEALSEKNARLLEETRRRGEQLQALVRRVGDALAAGLDKARSAELVVEQARQMIPADTVVLSVREEGNAFRALAVADAHSVSDGAGAPGWTLRDFPFLQEVLDRSHPVVIADVAADNRLMARERAALRRDGIAAMLLAPLRGRGERVIGMLSLLWTTQAATPTLEEFNVADVLATQAAAALENARLYEDLERAEARLKEQLAEVTQARDFVRRILQNVQAAVLVLSAEDEYVIQSANALAEAMPDTEREQDGLAERRLADVFPGLGDLLSEALHRAVGRGESTTLTDALYDGFARGTTYWTFSITPQRDPITRRVSQVILLALETTDRIRLLRERDRNVREQQQRANELDATLRSLGDGVLLCDPSGRIVSMNRAGGAILDCGEAVIGERIETWAARISLRYPSGQAVPPGALPLARTLQSRLPTEREEYLVYTQDGEKRIVELTVTPVSATGEASESGPNSVSGGAVAVFRDITALKDSRQQEAAANKRVETLVEISRRLNATLDLAAIHAIITEGALALLPGAPEARALLYAFDGDGKPLLFLGSTPDEQPKRPKSLREAAPLLLPFDAASKLIWQVYVARQPVVSGAVPTDPLFAADSDRAFLRGAGPGSLVPQSALVLPLIARDFVSGHLVVTSSAPGAFDDPRLLDALTNLAALAVIARANARLYLQMKQKADELDALWTVGKAIAEKLELNEVVDTLTDRVRTVMGGELCTLSLFQNAPPGLRRLRVQGTAQEDACLYRSDIAERADDPCDSAAQEAVHTGEPAMLVGLPNPPLGACKWRAFAGQSGTHSVMAVPLNYGAETLGALTVYTRGDTVFTPEQGKLLSTLASLAVAVVRNAQTYAHEQNIAETLQKSFLPEKGARVDGLEIAQKYYPTLLDEARIGGDYYDFIPLGPQRIAVVIGDISGKGLAAAVYTAMAKYTLRAFAAQGMTPQEVVSRANVAIARYTTGEIFSTLFYGVVDLEAGTLTYVNAGHEPPQLAKSAGSVVSLLPTGLMLGAFADADYDEQCEPLHPGDVLALYTDGLSDSRASDGAFFGEEGIRAHLAELAGQDAETVAASLHRAALAFSADGRQRDDIALLVLRLLAR